MGVAHIKQPCRNKRLEVNAIFAWKTWILYGSEDRGQIPRKKLLEMADFGGVAQTWQPGRMNRLEVSIWLCMRAPNTRAFPDMNYMPKCSLLNIGGVHHYKHKKIVVQQQQKKATDPLSCFSCGCCRTTNWKCA